MKIYEQTYADLTDELKRRFGRGAYHAGLLFRSMYRDLATDPVSACLPGLPADLAAGLKALAATRPGKVTRTVGKGNVCKFVTTLYDGLEIESVILPMARHETVCLSTQAGCRQGCRFCETGKQGFQRHLAAEEIIGQVIHARRLRGKIVRNAVFMGMGEPLDNFDNVVRAIRVLNDQHGLDIALRRMTVSTVGIADRIGDLGHNGLTGLHLFVSINAPNDSLRSRLMPVNRKYPLAAIKRALLAVTPPRSGRHMLGYILIPGVNDSREHARQLSDYVHDIPAKINLIPHNPGPASPYGKPAEKEIKRFLAVLRKENVVAIRRNTLGADLQAACGQLRSRRGAEHPAP